MVNITLSDGTVINNVEMNGNDFRCAATLTAEDFDGKLDEVTIEGDGEQFTIEDGYLYLIEQVGNRTRFIIGGKTDKMKQDELNTELELALTELYELIIGG